MCLGEKICLLYLGKCCVNFFEGMDFFFFYKLIYIGVFLVFDYDFCVCC